MTIKETENLLYKETNTLHTLNIDDLLQRLKTSKHGLTNSQAKEFRSQNGPNRITPPNTCPQWLCCLLSLRSQTRKMEMFDECVPESAKVVREGRSIIMDSNSLVVGDIVKVGIDESVPADIRIIEQSEDCTFGISLVHKRDASKRCVLNDCPDCAYEESPNIAFLGYVCLQGSCVGVVVATGSETLLAGMIRKGEWPPASAVGEEQRSR